MTNDGVQWSWNFMCHPRCLPQWQLFPPENPLWCQQSSSSTSRLSRPPPPQVKCCRNEDFCNVRLVAAGEFPDPYGSILQRSFSKFLAWACHWNARSKRINPIVTIFLLPLVVSTDQGKGELLTSHKSTKNLKGSLWSDRRKSLKGYPLAPLAEEISAQLTIRIEPARSS